MFYIAGGTPKSPQKIHRLIAAYILLQEIHGMVETTPEHFSPQIHMIKGIIQKMANSGVGPDGLSYSAYRTTHRAYYRTCLHLHAPLTYHQL